MLPVVHLVRSPSPARLSALLPEHAAAAFTYAEVGATLAGPPPAGYRMLDAPTVVGTGRAVFERVADGLLSWRLQAAAGLVTAATAPTAEPGVTVLSASPGPYGLLVPCRVVGRVEELRRRGFAYGTLPGHPLQGEELFAVELADDGTVRVRISSFSRPTGLPALVPPLSRLVQDLANRHYGRVAKRLAA